MKPLSTLPVSAGGAVERIDTRPPTHRLPRLSLRPMRHLEACCTDWQEQDRPNAKRRWRLGLPCVAPEGHACRFADRQRQIGVWLAGAGGAGFA